MTMDIYSHVLTTMQGDAMSQLNDALMGYEGDKELLEDEKGDLLDDKEKRKE